MKDIFFTVGPSQLYPTVPKHIQTALNENVPSLSHRSDAFKKINKTTQTNLRKLLDIPETHHIFYTSSALEAMERVIENTVHKDVIHFVNGSFSREFYRIAIDLKKRAVQNEVSPGEGFSFENVFIPKKTELICLVQNETSTGASLPMDEVYKLKRRHPDKLIALDIVSSAPYISVDFTKIDMVFFSVQKGFGLPAGLGILIVNDKAITKALALSEKGDSIGSYHNFLKLREFETEYQTRETPNVLAIYLLGKVAEDMLERGIGLIRKETDQKAELLYKFFDAHPKYKPFVDAPFRSKTTVVIDVKGESTKVIKTTAAKGFHIAKGYGKFKEEHIRIGNFPALSISDLKKLLKTL